MEQYDFLVLGGGGSGLAATMYAARLGLKTLVLGSTHGSELPVGGVITTTDIVENYPGFKSISGVELAKKLEEHTRSYDLVTMKNEKATEIKWSIKVTGGIFGLVNAEFGETISSMSANNQEEISTGLFFGLGPISINVTVECIEGSLDNKITDGKIFFILTKI